MISASRCVNTTSAANTKQPETKARKNSERCSGTEGSRSVLARLALCACGATITRDPNTSASTPISALPAAEANTEPSTPSAGKIT